jgi:hypothetical protein
MTSSYLWWNVGLKIYGLRQRDTVNREHENPKRAQYIHVIIATPRSCLHTKKNELRSLALKCRSFFYSVKETKIMEVDNNEGTVVHLVRQSLPSTAESTNGRYCWCGPTFSFLDCVHVP